MIGFSGMSGINGLNAYYRFPGGGSYGGSYGIAAAIRNAQNMGKISGAGYGTKKAATPEAPVEQVRPVTPVRSETAAPIDRSIPSWRLDAGEEAVRMRIQYAQNTPQTNPSSAERVNELLKNAAGQNTANAPEAAWEGMPSYAGMDAAEMAVRLRIQYPGAQQGANEAQAAEEEKAAGPDLPGSPKKLGRDGTPAEDLNPLVDSRAADDDEPVGVDSVQKTVEDGKCETCENRKYQDGSDDMSVSYQNPTRIAPENVASAVRGHEMEHVSHEQLKAEQEGRKVVSQTVTLHTEICPECGKTYISGGTTRTVTAAKPEPVAESQSDPADQKAPAGLGI